MAFTIFLTIAVCLLAVLNILLIKKIGKLQNTIDDFKAPVQSSDSPSRAEVHQMVLSQIKQAQEQSKMAPDPVTWTTVVSEPINDPADRPGLRHSDRNRHY